MLIIFAKSFPRINCNFFSCSKFSVINGIASMQSTTSQTAQGETDSAKSQNVPNVDITLNVPMENLSFKEPSPSLGVPDGIKPQKRVSRKVILKPGHSLTHWVDRMKSGEDMTGLGGPSLTRVITMDELIRHNTPTDIWMAVRGKVYNITKYLDYHPGGIDILLKEGGKDATLLFDKNHRWVNIDRLLAPCQVGILKTLSLNA